MLTDIYLLHLGALKNCVDYIASNGKICERIKGMDKEGNVSEF
jgi:hypothetical protein